MIKYRRFINNEKYYNLNEGYLSKLDDNNETLISAVDVDNIDKYSKIEKDDKQSFEDFKTQYKGVIDMKCTQDYGNCEDKDLWEDCAKELFLTSKIIYYKEMNIKLLI